ncbi:MAG TPA: UMP kinase [Bacteroidales bacterium]|nr:UMP kinase [Bacteroidales bacterium]HQH18337.1 UMP kinase [Bacteroidales bacterium]HQI45347.1 UMP kinase [Bacteroidales bacterium]
MKFKRILLKLSGESLMGNGQYGIDSEKLNEYASEIKKITSIGIEVAIVIGGGNIFRGLKGVSDGFDRTKGDYMGMLATVINSIALQTALENINVPTQILSGLEIDPLCKKMSRQRAIEKLEKGRVVIIGGGTGNPFFTTDSAAVLRALEIKADIILKGTRVDGVYTADPEKDKSAQKYDMLTFEEAYEKKLNIMDLTAFTLCKENKLPIIVFNMNTKGNLLKIIKGEKIGTLILV